MTVEQPFDVRAAALAARDGERRAEQARQDAKRAEAEAKEAELLGAFHAEVEQAHLFHEGFAEATALTYVLMPEYTAAAGRPAIQITYQGEQWHLIPTTMDVPTEPDAEMSRDEIRFPHLRQWVSKRCYSIVPPTGNKQYGRVNVMPEALQLEVLQALGAREEAARVARAHQRQAAEAEAQARAIAAREQAEAQATSDAIRASLETLKREAEAELWRWPVGAAVTLYKWTWCTSPGGGRDSEGDEIAPSWADAYSLMHTTHGGWLDILPVSDTYASAPLGGARNTTDLRTIRISPEALPNVEAIPLSCLDDVPQALRAYKTATMPGVHRLGASYFFDGGPDEEVYEQATYRYEEGRSVTLLIGLEPIALLKTAIERAAEDGGNFITR